MVKKIETAKELNQYIDEREEGCKYWAKCDHTCPLPVCLSDSISHRKFLEKVRNVWIIGIYGETPVKTLIAEVFNISQRTVYRALEDK